MSAGGSSIISETVSVSAPISRFQSASRITFTSPCFSHSARNERSPSYRCCIGPYSPRFVSLLNGLLCFDAGLFDDPLPSRHIGSHTSGELVRRQSDDIVESFVVPLSIGRIVEHRHDVAVELIDDGLWRSPRREQRIPSFHLPSRQPDLGRNRHFRKIGQPRVAGRR